MLLPDRPTVGADQRLGVAIVVAAVLSLGAIHLLPEGQPLRILGGLALFLVLPGLSLRIVLIGELPVAERWASWVVDLALSIAASSLIALVAVVAGIGLSASVVASALALFVLPPAFMVAIGYRRQTIHQRDRRNPAVSVFLLTTCAVGLGAIVGTALGDSATREPFTVFALRDPSRTIVAIADGADQVPVRVEVIIESHEASEATFSLRVSGARVPASALRAFTIGPGKSRRVVLDLKPSSGNVGAIALDLMRSGSTTPYRTLRIPMARSPGPT